eukprot:CAMPEP_0119336132 /NCGR_PEP_ID=MMETSP1333-20130426/91200_1 /TAXON_ID=418940 /ORGANISM="Scyphosphaera apsteinii, Strain RCC1455" /LENGTH=573 /DNA_ID=CAMNT_0007346863 /DNA_START=285 /DNA_END=2006 /DNA_ORIENTATION=-
MDGSASRMPCPLDPGHSIFTKDLQRHLKICPKAKEELETTRLSCFSRNINSGCQSSDMSLAAAAAATQPSILSCGAAIHGSLTHRSTLSGLASISDNELFSLLRRIEAAHLSTALPVHPEADAAVEFPLSCSQPDHLHGVAVERNEGYARMMLNASKSCGQRPLSIGPDCAGAKRQKHTAQNEAIVRAMAPLGLLGEGDAIHVEFGAGKGGLAAAVSAASVPPSKLLLIDRIRPRGCVDSTLYQAGVECTRIKIDLRHLNLSRVEALWPNPEESVGAPRLRKVGIGKHLCGAATDYALRGMVNAGKTNSETTAEVTADEACGIPDASAADEVQAKSSPVMNGIVIASCCHHKCDWSSFVNKPFFTSLGFSDSDFVLLTLLSSWATNPTGVRKDCVHSKNEGGVESGTVCGGEARLAGSNETEVGMGSKAGGVAKAAGHLSANEMSIGDERPRQTSDQCILRDDDDEDQSTESHAEPVALVDQIDKDLGNKVPAADRLKVGYACKRLIDTARLLYLRKYGYRGWMQQYCAASVSPENVLLIALPVTQGARKPSSAEACRECTIEVENGGLSNVD